MGNALGICRSSAEERIGDKICNSLSMPKSRYALTHQPDELHLRLGTSDVRTDTEISK